MGVSVLAFGAVSEAVLRAEKGQMVSAIGRLTRGSYTGRDGTEREQWAMLAELSVAAGRARPRARNDHRVRHAYAARETTQERNNGQPRNGGIPF